MRTIALVFALVVGLALPNVCQAIGEGKEKPEPAQAAKEAKEARSPEKAVEARINADVERPAARPDRNPVIRERPTQPADRHFTDIRQRSPFGE